MSDSTGKGTNWEGNFPGVARLYLAQDVAFMREEDAVADAMLRGWEAQQIGGRSLAKQSVAQNLATVRRFSEHAQSPPWLWTATDFDHWMADLVSTRDLAPTTLRRYQWAIRGFCTYITSEHYDWPAECERRFGTHPIQICHEWNTVRHLLEAEAKPGRRPLTREELQRLFDYADGLVEDRIARNRKGAAAAYRDATMLKVIYAWGLRANEAARLDVTDFSPNPHAPEFGSYGSLLVRFGKGSAGSGPKRRSVATLFPWAVDVVRDYVENVWPHVRLEGSGTLWVTERGTRIGPKEISERFSEYRDALGFDRRLVMHCLRNTYLTHLVEMGLDQAFAQRQAGHKNLSTTGIYTHVNSDYLNDMVRKSMETRLPALGELKQED